MLGVEVVFEQVTAQQMTWPPLSVWSTEINQLQGIRNKKTCRVQV